MDLPSLNHPAPVSPGPGVVKQSLVLEEEKPSEAGRRGVCTQTRSTTPQGCSGSSHIPSLLGLLVHPGE